MERNSAIWFILIILLSITVTFSPVSMLFTLHPDRVAVLEENGVIFYIYSLIKLIKLVTC